MSQAIDPEVSVIMSCYNAERFVREAIESVLAQSYGNFELIVVDDKSTDNSLDVVGGFESEARIRIFTNSQNRGHSYSANKGIKQAKGRVIAFLDADDVYSPEKLKLQIQEISRGNRLIDEVVYTDCYKISEEGRMLRPSVVDANKALKGDMVVALLKDAEYLAYGTMMCLRESAIEVGLFDESLRIREDFDFALRLAQGRPFVGLFKPLYGYRMHSDSVMHKTPVPESYRMKLAIMQKYLKGNAELLRGKNGAEIRRQIARCLIITRDYKSAISYSLKDPGVLGDFYYWLRRR